LVLFQLGGEISELYSNGWAEYRSDWWNYPELLSVAIVIMLVLLRITIVVKISQLDFGDPASFTRNFGKISTLQGVELNWMAILAVFYWARLLKYMRVFKSFGILLRIILKMSIDLTIFMIVFMVFEVGFSLAFHGLLGQSVLSQNTWGASLGTVIRMGFFGDFNWDDFQQSQRILAMLLFFVHLLIAAILLLNLLIAMLNKSYADVIQSVTEEYLLEKAQIVFSYHKQKTNRNASVDIIAKEDQDTEIELQTKV